MMADSIEFIPGPLTSDATRTAAEEALRKHPSIQKGSSYAMEQLNGQWVAAVIHEAGPFPGGPPGGAPSDSEEESPAPKTEGPVDDEPSEGPPSDGDSDDGAPKEKSDDQHGKAGGELHQVVEMLHAIAEALGLPIGGLGASPVPGGDDNDVPPPAGPPHGLGGPGGPPGAGGPPMGPPGMGGPGDAQVIKHQRSLKPGEVPPGGTPVGAPAFASVRENHPWGHLPGKVASFEVSDKIGDMPLNDVHGELKSLASEINYRVARFREDRDADGDRVAVAVITRH